MKQFIKDDIITSQVILIILLQHHIYLIVYLAPVIL